MAAKDNNRVASALALANRRDRPLLLDGATGTELERRGLDCSLPLWSTRALLDVPDAVQAVHAAYAEAGCRWITAATFRTQRRVLDRAGLGEWAGTLTRRAVDLARAGAPGRVLLGSAPPLEDCYRPDLSPDDPSLNREHAEHAAHLAAAGVDGILVETHPTIREARCAAAAARDVGLPAIVSFTCDDRGRLLSGESLSAALAEVRPMEPVAVGVNCLTPPAVRSCLPALGTTDLPVLISGNLGAPCSDGSFGRRDDCSPAEFADLGEEWVRAGATIVGGCCGTTPGHLRALADRMAEPATGN